MEYTHETTWDHSLIQLR